MEPAPQPSPSDSGWLGHCGKGGALVLPAEMSRHPCPMLFSLDKVPITMPALGAQHRLAGWQRVAQWCGTDVVILRQGTGVL